MTKGATHWIYLICNADDAHQPWFYCRQDQYGYFKLNVVPREYINYSNIKVIGESEIVYQDVSNG